MTKKLILFVLLTLSFNNYSAICEKWSESQKIGELDTDIINEASGLIVSEFQDRLYHINDSGDGPFFYQTRLNGLETQKIKIENFSPYDVEDLAYGNYKGRRSIFIGDIGDNAKKRKNIKVVIIGEKKTFQNYITPLKTIKAIYPDGPHNAEGMAMHPNGDLFILTKEQAKNNKALPAKLYKISKNKIENAYNDEILQMDFVAEFDFPTSLKYFTHWGKIVTSFDISQDGSKFIIMTYQAVMEIDINLDLSSSSTTNLWASNYDHYIYRTTYLPQQEAVAFSPDGKSFIYTTEYALRLGALSAPIFKVDCI